MKTFKYIKVLLFGLVIGLASCEDLKIGEKFLQKPPSGDITIDTIFSNAEYARRIVWKSYSTLPYGLVTGYNYRTAMWYGVLESLTDLSHSMLGWDGTNKLYYSGLYNAGFENPAPDGNGLYGTKYRFKDRKAWESIRHAWIFIENADRVPDLDTSEKKRLIAEAKIIIAIQYAEMMRHYGALPILDHAIDTEESNLPPRNTLEETVNFIVKLLDEAIATPELPWRIPANEVSNWDGRLTRGAAAGLKTRVLLFAASPLFNSSEPYFEGEAAKQKMTWFGSYDENRWKAALKACEDFFRANNSEGYPYALVQNSNYRMAFRDAYRTRGTSESLISIRRDYTIQNCVLQSVRWGTGCITKEYFDMFPMADGTPFVWNDHIDNPFINRDPRLYETIVVDNDIFGGDHHAAIYMENPDDKKNYPKGEDYKNKKRSLDSKSLDSGFPQRKFVLDRQGEFKASVIHWPYLRLAEVYLNYAEALNECGKTAEAYQYVDAVRARVGMNGLQTGLTKEQMREEILRERACEFGYEEVRFFDLIRWKRVKDMTKPLHGINLYKHKTTGAYKIEVKEMPGRAWQKEGGFSPKWYLSAFPSQEIDKGYGLVQNPGWE